MSFDPRMCAEFGRIFTVKTAAEALHCSEDHIVRLIKAETLAASDLGLGKHREFRIDEADIDKMLAKTKFVKKVKLPLPSRRKVRESGDSTSASASSDFDARLQAKMKKYGV